MGHPRLTVVIPLLLIAAVAASCGSSTAGQGDKATTMPAVTGKTLDDAKSAIKDAGYGDEVKVDGGGLFGVVVESNWEVCEQNPAAGTTVAGTPTLTVARSCVDGESEESEATPSETTSTTPEETAPAEPKVTAISVDDLLKKLNAGGSKAGDVFRVTGELFQSDLWSTGATGDYSVMLKAQGGKQDLPFFVDEAEAEKWTDGTKVELILKNVKKTINGETSDGWLEAQSAKILSGGTTKEHKEAASRQNLLSALTDYADTINSRAGTTVIDSIRPGSADGVYYVNLNPSFATLPILEAQSTIKTMNNQIVDIFEAEGSSTPMLKYFLAGDVVAENKEIVDPWDVTFKGMLDG
jgi:colicin import membrane protein